MDSFHPMFNEINENIVQISTNITQHPKKVRKERSDKRKDIRIPLTSETKQLIKKISFQYNTYPTIFTSDLLTESLHRFNEFELVEYPIHSKSLAVAKLDKETFEILRNYCIEWDCSIRKAAHRVVINSLRKEGYIV